MGLFPFDIERQPFDVYHIGDGFLKGNAASYLKREATWKQRMK